MFPPQHFSPAKFSPPGIQVSLYWKINHIRILNWYTPLQVTLVLKRITNPLEGPETSFLISDSLYFKYISFILHWRFRPKKWAPQGAWNQRPRSVGFFFSTLLKSQFSYYFSKFRFSCTKYVKFLISFDVLLFLHRPASSFSLHKYALWLYLSWFYLYPPTSLLLTFGQGLMTGSSHMSRWGGPPDHPPPPPSFWRGVQTPPPSRWSIWNFGSSQI